jgi:hypothetical protein
MEGSGPAGPKERREKEDRRAEKKKEKEREGTGLGQKRKRKRERRGFGFSIFFKLIFKLLKFKLFSNSFSNFGNFTQT